MSCSNCCFLTAYRFPRRQVTWSGIPISWRIFQFVVIHTVPGGSEVNASACNAEDLGSIPGLGRSPGEGNGNPLQYSCLENPMGGGARWATVHGVAKTRIQQASPVGSLKKQENSRKTSISALLTMPKPLTVWITKTVENSSRDENSKPPDLPPEKSVCRSGSNS